MLEVAHIFEVLSFHRVIREPGHVAMFEDTPHVELDWRFDDQSLPTGAHEVAELHYVNGGTWSRRTALGIFEIGEVEALFPEILAEFQAWNETNE